MEKNNRDVCYFSATRLAEMDEKRLVHQYNDNAIRLTKTLSDLCGMTDMGLHMVRIEPGRETTEHHFHGQDEEFVFIVSGHGLARLGEDSFPIGPGDVLLFAKNGPAHSILNDSSEDLTYLMGGTRSPVDVCTYPHLARRQYNVGGKREWADLEAFTKVER